MNLPPRVPLRVLTDEEKQKLNDSLGLDKDNLPKSLTSLERSVALGQQIVIPPPARSSLMPTFTFPSWLVSLAKFLTMILGGATLLFSAVSPPAWVAYAVFAVGALCALITGADMVSPFHGKPLLYGPAAAAMGTVAVAVFNYAQGMPDGFLQHVLVLACILLTGAVGAVLPTKAPATA